MEWDEYAFNLIGEIKKKSKDPSTKTGCLILNRDHKFVSAGFNGFPRGIEDDIKIVPERYETPAKYLWTEHAERNAIYGADGSLKDCIIYVPWWPCADCARGIIQSGISEVVLDGDSPEFNDEALKARWKDQHDVSKIMFEESGVMVRVFNRG
jgi:dCMP deaminase